MRRLALAALLALVPVAGAEDRRCTCEEGCGSYLYLRCPLSPPADPDPCPAAANGTHPNKNPPAAWNDMCWQSPRMDCFLRRHAASWGIACSLCHDLKCCPFPNWANCPECHGEAKEGPPQHAEMVELAKKQQQIGGRNFEVAMSAHFVVLTDIRSLKIASRSGPRVARQHELLHLYLQRAEMARRDFEKVFGSAYNARSAVVLVKSKSQADHFAATYWGTPCTVLRGGGSKTTASGYATNGTCIDGKTDDDLHFTMRHMIGHLLMSTYMRVEPHEKYCPQWLDKGCAHWLEKLHPRADDFATFCQHEGSGGGGKTGKAGGIVSGSGARWDDKARKIAREGPDKNPVEAMFQASTFEEMNYEMHIRSWSWFSTFATEEPEAFKVFVQGLRRADEARAACKAAWGQAPEIVDGRWREFVLGKRGDVEATNREKEKETEVEEATSGELRDIAKETDVQLLAGRIRGLERCQNPKTAALLVSLVDSRSSARVRECIALVLEATSDPEVLAYLRTKGFERAGKLGRATLCRVFGKNKDAEAVPVLRTALDDSFWLVRAQAARALAQLGDRESMPKLEQMASSGSSGKLRIAALDALGMLGKEAESSIGAIERNLMHRDWQVKVATCDAFKAIGSTAAVDSLIGRLDQEGGRVHDDIRSALKALTGIDKEWKAETWRIWWSKQKKFAELEKKSREELGQDPEEPPSSTPDDRYAQKKPPTYYGIKVYARAIGYVLDISDSMRTGFIVSDEWARRLGHTFKGTSKMEVAKEELVQSIRELDPRTRLNLVFFNDTCRIWKSAPVAAGAMGENAVSAVENITPSGRTNYFDALRLILGLEEDDELGWSPTFADTPDTLFFLTDGAPTDGEITKADELLAWFNERNRFSRLRVHVIALGHTGVDHEFLAKLAESNSGKYVNLTGTY